MIDNRFVRLAVWNVLCGERAAPEEFAKALEPCRPDAAAFCEVPAGGWTEAVGRCLGMDYAFTGSISTAGHENKYKSLLSRHPLADPREIPIEGSRWGANASAVRAGIVVNGLRLSLYSLHIPKTTGVEDSGAEFAAGPMIADDPETHRILMGDFNCPLDHAAMRCFEAAGFRSVWRDLPFDTGRISTLERREGGVIDHLLYSRKSNVRVFSGGAVETHPMLSDHKPVWAELMFTLG